MAKKILVPLDGTIVGEAVIPKLEDLLLKTIPGNESEIILLRVISKINFNVLTHDERAQLPISDDEKAQLTGEAVGYLENVAGKMKKKGFNVKTMVTFGSAPQEIVKAARAINASLIAMSTHSRSGVVRWAIGSVSEKVMRLEGKIPVLALRANPEKEAPVITMPSLQSMVKRS